MWMKSTIYVPIWVCTCYYSSSTKKSGEKNKQPFCKYLHRQRCFVYFCRSFYWNSNCCSNNIYENWNYNYQNVDWFICILFELHPGTILKLCWRDDKKFCLDFLCSEIIRFGAKWRERMKWSWEIWCYWVVPCPAGRRWKDNRTFPASSWYFLSLCNVRNIYSVLLYLF